MSHDESRDASNPGEIWRIGALARATGLTVRTLHHYDQLGLLSPQSRTAGGHRCYTEDDVRRLQRIVALRSLGIPLDDVRTLLDGKPDPTDLLRRQLTAVDERLRKLSDLRARLTRILDHLSRDSEPSTRQLLQLVEDTVALDEPLTPDEFAELKEHLKRRTDELGETDVAALIRKKKETWDALSPAEQERMVERRRRPIPSRSSMVGERQ